MTLLEALQRSADFLARKAVDSPRLQAELLLAHVLKLPRMQLYLQFERTLPEVELEQYRELVRRRGQREPLQQLTGTTSFCGLELAVNRHVLVPRPETELLAEQAWSFLNGLNSVSKPPHESDAASTQPASPTVLDYGTGSGCLAIAIAVHCPAAQVYARERSSEALEVARQNATRHQLAQRIRFLLGDGFAAVPSGVKFTLIVSNPPYIPSAEIAQLQPEVRDYEPHQALDGGLDGLDYYRRLAGEAGAFLLPQGKLMLEFGDGQAAHVRRLLEEQKWVVERILDDYTQRPRILIARAKFEE